MFWVLTQASYPNSRRSINRADTQISGKNILLSQQQESNHQNISTMPPTQVAISETWCMELLMLLIHALMCTQSRDNVLSHQIPWAIQPGYNTHMQASPYISTERM
jgi:hypothetical protein